MGVFIPQPPPKVKVKSVVTEAQVREILEEADRDRDGRLSQEELKNALKKIGSRWAAFRAFRCLQHADTNHDGKISGAAEIDKLVAYILKCYAG